MAAVQGVFPVCIAVCRTGANLIISEGVMLFEAARVFVTFETDIFEEVLLSDKIKIYI